MWPGNNQPPGGDNQPPGGEQHPQDQNPYQQPGYQQPNPYQQPGYQQPGYPQPGYQQPNPYGQQPGQPQWGAPTVPLGAPEPPCKDGRKTKVTAIVAAAAVLVAAGVTGFLVLGGGDEDDTASGTSSPSPTASASATESGSSGAEDNPRGGEAEKPTVPGWKVVVNPKWGTAFDVPADWEVESPGVFMGFEDDQKGDGSVLIGMSAPAYFKSKWCTSDDDKDGTTEDTELAATGTKGQNGAKNTDDVARNDSAWWVFGGYTDQKDSSKKLLKIGEPKKYTTESGVEGSVATTYSSGVPKTGKCDSDGKATTFAFKNSKGDFVSWTFFGAKGVEEEVPDATVQKILSTVRLHGDPEDS
ncbi:hypothetical protein [Streptomyces minutiscleroticus]|uniref:DUF8017 domain-containing protein n=1 Tax=Streptomyces minutiscleroticus TaxID=68238 RepID=A0A918NVI4_9ACTN|nr:hypothetical protein [Streptomyces minutiscleroticus]GGX99826.1 hypothetical protein GCM10010358_61920 [Streptomyces minutiscleroticus]